MLSGISLQGFILKLFWFSTVSVFVNLLFPACNNNYYRNTSGSQIFALPPFNKRNMICFLQRQSIVLWWFGIAVVVVVVVVCLLYNDIMILMEFDCTSIKLTMPLYLALHLVYLLGPTSIGTMVRTMVATIDVRFVL